jgi:asparagine synthase (glutamine-hydrolysing)
MQRESSRPVKTFCIGFRAADYDEARYAKAVAAHLGTDHTECYVTPEEAREVIPRLPEIYDEPFGDSSQIPTYLVSALARKHVTVCLSGDGGDELFCGYRRYFTLHSLWKRIGWCPARLRRGLARMLPTGKPNGQSYRLRRRMATLRTLLSLSDGMGAYDWFHAHWRNPAEVVEGFVAGAAREEASKDSPGGDLFEQMAFRDFMSYLPDDILVKVDRASMAVGLEARVPLLDHRVAEFAWGLPCDVKIRDGGGKWLLRRLLERFVPRQLVERPKMGFGVPLDSWLRGPLRDWAEALLDEGRLRREGYLNAAAVRQKWTQHLSGACDWHYHLWDLLMFQAWLEAARNRRGAAGATSSSLSA